MRQHILIWPVLLAAATGLISAEPEARPLTRAETVETRKRLEGFETGTVTLKQLVDDSGGKGCWLLVTYYGSHTNSVSPKMKLPISRAFLLLNRHPEAVKLATEYVNVYTNDWQGWRMLGHAHLRNKSFDDAIRAYKRAAELGDEGSYVKLGLAYFAAGRSESIGDILPHLYSRKEAKTATTDERFEAIAALAVHAVNTDQPELLLKALEKVEPKEIVEHDDLLAVVRVACKQFKDKDPRIDQMCAEVRRAEQKAAKASTDSK